MIEPIDLESRVGDGDHLSLRVWLRLLACTNLITGRARLETAQRVRYHDAALLI